MTTHDDYKKLSVPDDTQLSPCPVCGSKAELWQYSETFDTPTSKAVMCSNNSIDDSIDGLECLLYMPKHNFYCATAKLAIKFWNDFSANVLKKRAENEALLDLKFDAKTYWHKHHKDCGTAYRGCSPKCPKDWYEETNEWICYKTEYGYTTDKDESI